MLKTVHRHMKWPIICAILYDDGQKRLYFSSSRPTAAASAALLIIGLLFKKSARIERGDQIHA